jgi:hypothetical protein
MIVGMAGQLAAISMTRVDPDWPTVVLARLLIFRSLARNAHYAG